MAIDCFSLYVTGASRTLRLPTAIPPKGARSLAVAVGAGRVGRRGLVAAAAAAVLACAVAIALRVLRRGRVVGRRSAARVAVLAAATVAAGAAAAAAAVGLVLPRGPIAGVATAGMIGGSRRTARRR